jgi:hypothetical protein
MDSQDFTTLLGTMNNLWPYKVGNLTEEETNAWRRVCGSRSLEDCQECLRELACEIKFFPKPCELAGKLKTRRRSAGTSTAQAEDLGPWHSHKRFWMDASPNRTAEIMGWSDGECAERNARQGFEKSAQLYGANHPGTIHSWFKWQKARVALGDRPDDLVQSGDSDAVKKQFEDEGGAVEALRINQAYRDHL